LATPATGFATLLLHAGYSPPPAVVAQKVALGTQLDPKYV
jgi:hypothetical protein